MCNEPGQPFKKQPLSKRVSVPMSYTKNSQSSPQNPHQRFISRKKHQQCRHTYDTNLLVPPFYWCSLPVTVQAAIQFANLKESAIQSEHTLLTPLLQKPSTMPGLFLSLILKAIAAYFFHAPSLTTLKVIRACAFFSMLLVKITLSILRVATQASLFLEAQRLLLRLLRPTRRNHLAQAERHVLRSVRSKLSHHFLPDGHGNKLHVIEAAPSIPRTTAVLLHGHSMSAAFWFRNIDDLVSLGFRVLAVDLLGWGRSQRPPFRGHTAEEAVEWYLRSFRGIVRELRLASFVLIGHSLGAYLSMEYAKSCPRMVEHLVLVSPAASTRRIPVSRALYFSLPPQSIVRRGGLLGLLLFFLKYPKRGTYIRDRLRDYTYHLATQYPPSGENAVRPIIRLFGPRRAECTRPIVEHLRLFRVPVQIICGETDSSMPVESVHDLYREMRHRGFKVRLSIVKGADHCPMLEKPDDFFTIISGLCKRQLIGAPELYDGLR